ncbi:hypothetical protein MAPG_03613 [Magnaporthiopsis poae ATCC 64411]|uniref:Regulatory factor Sgt1 n=1 Tax=Magnaporthiopsis poae (strain ATCC 64411 / 73-15) TaxID=644358 RepID=A0A0C4DUH4_MAGP6|nr:hypothetical protein MAPG_03613 [Magnaporthiopsis poae ATCC 64411]
MEASTEVGTREIPAKSDEDGAREDDVPVGFGKTSLPENCVEYMVFLIDSQLDARQVLSRLETVKKSALQLAAGLTKDYIWQRDSFGLEVKSRSGLLFLHGITDHGDSVEDEWLVVYMLRELSKSFKEIWIRVFDSDGEFLLVEAANVAPKWLNPEMDSNRVWINDGRLLLVPLFIGSNPEALVHSTFVESEAFYRLEKYPGHIADSIHCSQVTVPRKLAYVLHARPKAIAPAVEAFYLRDPVSLKPVVSAPSSGDGLEFTNHCPVGVLMRKRATVMANGDLRPPSPGTVSVQFDGMPPMYKTTMARLYEIVERMGMKVTTGFELLAAGADQSRSRVAREVGIILEDLREDGGGGLPTDDEIRSWEGVDMDDDEAWLDINFDDFDRELQGRGKKGKDRDGDASGFGSSAAQADLRKIVSRFEAFLNDDEAGIDGAEVDDMDMDDDDDSDLDDDDSGDEDKAVSFDEEEFHRMMREMMGLPAAASSQDKTAATPAAAAAHREVAPADDDDDEETEAIKQLAAQMEVELSEHGALKLDPKPGKKQRALKGKGTDQGESSSGADAQAGEDSDDDEVDIDYNLAKNLLESFKGQAGVAGPAGNILSMLGMSLPRDEDDQEDEKSG